ncbi:hypothetical protein ACEQPO_29025 [Bacillus sp. SL00103]
MIIPESVMTLQAEEFEKLLEASEAKNEWPSFLQRAENEELVQAFVSMYRREKERWTLMKVVYDKNNTPDEIYVICYSR